MPHSALILAVWWQGGSNASGRYVWGLKTLGEVLSKAFFFVLWVPALAGLVCFHRRFRTVPGTWMLLLVCATLAGLLYRVAVRMGYLSDRHTILILACGVPWAAAALDGAAVGLARLLASLRPAVAGKRWADGRAWAAGLLLVVAVAPLARTLEPLHGDRVGFRAAGCWLRGHAAAAETVCDPFGWAGYYAGRYFREDAPVYREEATDGDDPWTYVVVEKGTNAHSHLVTVARAEELAGRMRASDLHRPRPARQRNGRNRHLSGAKALMGRQPCSAAASTSILANGSAATASVKASVAPLLPGRSVASGRPSGSRNTSPRAAASGPRTATTRPARSSSRRPRTAPTHRPSAS